MEENNFQLSNRVVVIGAGMVGSTVAFSLLMKEVTQSVLLIDIAEDLVNAHVLDLEDAAVSTTGVKVLQASYSDIQTGDIVVITAGAAQKPDETRLDLAQTNLNILKKIAEQINLLQKDLMIMLVTNPVDVLTHFAYKYFEQPSERIFGSGTTLDTARLKAQLSKKIDINPQNIHAYVLGEHGDSSFPALSSGMVGGEKISESVNISEIEEAVREKAYKIIQGKKATYFGIGATVAGICKSILRNENKIYTLSVDLNGVYGINDVSLGIPVRINNQGYSIETEVHLRDSELEKMKRSAQTLQELQATLT